jgi:hypothetical protein
MRRTASVLLLLSACSDYDLTRKDDNNGGDDTSTDSVDTDTDTVDPPAACEPSEAPAREVGVNDSCDVPYSTGTFTPVVEWELNGHFAYGPPIVGNLDDDNGDGYIGAGDTPDVLIVPNDGSGLTAVDGATGSVKWTSRAVTFSLGQVAIGDVDGDGVPEIVGSDGSSLPDQIVLMDNLGVERWRTRVRNRWGGLDLYSALNPAIADMDNDGFAEIVAGSNILAYDGTLLGAGREGVGACPNESGSYLEGSVAVPVDVNGDGVLEVAVGNAIYNMDGTTMHANGLDDGVVTVADFDLDGEPEFVVASGNDIYTLETDMSQTGWSDEFRGTNYIGPIAADDLDGDGQPEFVAAGASELVAYKWDGTRLWTQRVTDSSGASGPILFDFEMDGYPEVVYADEVSVKIFNGLDGRVKLQSSDHASYTLFETPVVADVDNDGEVEIIMSHGQGPKGLTVYGDRDHSWPPGRPIWNQHAYTLTNVEDDGSIPTTVTPNWDLYNNFRSGDAGLPPAQWNDVLAEVVEVCTEECPDRLYLLVRVWNQGTEEIPAGISVVVRAGQDGAVVASVTTPAAIASGMTSEGIAIEVDNTLLGGAEPFVEADRDADLNSALAECAEDNNAVLSSGACD